MKLFRVIRNYLFYCGIEKEEYDEVKKSIYVSNFKVWRVLNCLMTCVFAFLFVDSILDDFLMANTVFYMIAFIYSMVVTFVFFVTKKGSIVTQQFICLSILVLLAFSMFITRNKPEFPATTFIALLLIAPMFALGRPIYMGFVLAISSVWYLVWMHGIKPPDIWHVDLVNVFIFTVVSFVIYIVSSSSRIKEFVLTREINIQKDVDDLTGLNNKGALIRKTNKYLTDTTKDKGIMFLLDIDYFKDINDTFGHAVGDNVIVQLGDYLKGYFKGGEIVGRFGGDEFVVFAGGTNDAAEAERIANEMIAGAPERIILPDKNKKISFSVGMALYSGEEKSFYEIFKKADIALYDLKSDRTKKYTIYSK